MQDTVASILETYGAFLIPALVFAAGLVGYGVLYAMSRRGLLDWLN
ncbi:hypothetical protein [Halomarina rubra]|uniref:Uncharacterized protein n=1 Tax=Halomarina rubra TaxID=2071873 RepID=A0ABD6AZF1_9EURY|nr:hypothetical protein [Halomarina rubra]